MRVVLGVSTVLGVVGVVSAFGLFYVAERVFHIDRQHIQTMMYLKLSVAGHLTIFLTRTRGPFWSIRPARILWGAVLGTQALATCIALFGFGLVTPLAWSWALMVWGWALASFLLTDPIKLLTYRVLDHFGDRDEPAVGSKPRVDPAAVSPAAVSPAAVYKGAFPVGSAQADTQPKPVPAAELKGDKAEAVPAISQKPSAGSDPATATRDILQSEDIADPPHGRHQRAEVLEAVPPRVRGMPERHQHGRQSLVRRARRRQGQRPADRRKSWSRPSRPSA